MNRIIVLHAALPSHWPPARELAALSRVHYAKRLELERLAAHERLASLCGLALAEAAIARLRGATTALPTIEHPQGGKPRVPGGPDFSISHCHGRVACAASMTCRVGLDVEQENGTRPDGWLQRWTKTEAALKAAGLGLRSAAHVRIDRGAASIEGQGSALAIVPLELGRGYVAHLACSAAPDPLEVVQVDELL